jgi:hypothetical protein
MVLESNKGRKIEIPYDFIYLELIEVKRGEDHLNSLFWNLTNAKNKENFHSSGFGM